MLEVKNLTHKYVSGSTITQALNDVNIRFDDCGMVFVVGRSGSGKTTLLNMLGGLNKPTSGTIIADGLDVTALNEASLNHYRKYVVGFIFQEYHLLENKTAFDNVNIALELGGRKVKEDKIEALFRKLEINGLEKRYIPELSGGQKQRVAIARALVKDPKFILADEPTGALDRKTSEELYKLLQKLAKDRLVIIVSHDYKAAKRYANSIIELSDGLVVSNLTNVETKVEHAMCCEFPKSRLSPRRAFQLGAEKLFRHKIVLFLSVLILFVALSIMHVFLSYDFSDINEKALNSMKLNATNYYLAQAGSESLDELKLSYSELEYETITSLKETLMPYSNYNASLYYKSQPLKGMMIMNHEIANRLHFELLAGKYPAKKGEVLISEYYYTCFKDLGYQNYFTGEKKAINSPDDLIGLKLYEIAIANNLGDLVITGVLKTDVKLNRYSKLKSEDNYELNISFSDCLNYSTDKFLYVSSEEIDAIVERNVSLSLLYTIGNNSKDLEVLKMLNDHNITIYGSVFAEINKAKEALAVFDEVLLIATVVIVIFSFIMLFYYFLTAVADEQRDSNILRLLGASRVDIVRIYFYRSLLLSFAVSSLSALGGWYLVEYLNSFLEEYFYIFQTLFSNRFTTSLIIIIACFVIAILSSIISVSCYIRKKPITLIS